MFQVRPVLFLLGLLLLGLALAMALPIAVDLADGNRNWRAFAAAMAVTVFAGGALLAATFERGKLRFGRREGFLITAIAWFVASAFGALPFAFADLGLSYAQAYFEAASGLTTSGSTVIDKLDTRPRGLLLWRAMLTGIGGAGIVVIAVALLPFLRVGGMQLFRAESSDKSEKVLSRASDIAVATLAAYLALAAICALVYWALGMSGFDAVTHAFTTVATGGFANYDDSFAAFKSPSIEWAATLFMALGGLPMVLYILLAMRRWRQAGADTQIRWFLAVIAFFTVAFTLWLVLERGMPFETALRQAAFNVVSIVTTTGYATADFGQWGSFPGIGFIALMFIGGCTGSTSGGIKVMRFEILGRLAVHTVAAMTERRAVRRMTYAGRPLEDDVVTSVTIFCFVYFLSFAGLAAALAATGLDFVTALTAAVAAVGNIGPGLGPIIGPAGNYATVNETALWLLSAGMILGRLEFMAAIVLFTTRFWRG
jgi:trk system potassium uptake protein TrkH